MELRKKRKEKNKNLRRREDTMTDKEVMQKAIDTYGIDAQEDMVIEEMSELAKAILKIRRYKKANDGDYTLELLNGVVDEIADVEIMLEQLKMMIDCGEEVQKQKARKLNRLKERLEEK
jgi:hypothetical protein